MRLGFGVTFLSQRVKHGKYDGIGVYTIALWNTLHNGSNTLYPLSFSGEELLTADLLGAEIDQAPLSYPLHSGLSAIFHRAWGEMSNYEKKIDLFFAPDHHIPFLKNTPVVATVMDIIPFVHPEWASSTLRKTKNYTFKKAVESATHIITISQQSKRDIIEHMDVDSDNISVVPLGVDQQFFIRRSPKSKLELIKKYGIDRDFFLFVGTLQPRKNILRLIQAYRILPENIKRETMLILVGQNGWGSDELRDEIEEMIKLGDGIWLSYLPQDEVLTLMQSAKAIVYPSLYEGFGLPIIEGFASQTPVITSNTTSMPEVAGDAALLVDPLSAKSIADAMQLLIEDDDLCKELTRRGLERVKQFTWEISAQKHLEVFESIAFKYNLI